MKINELRKAVHDNKIRQVNRKRESPTKGFDLAFRNFGITAKEANNQLSKVREVLLCV